MRHLISRRTLIHAMSAAMAACARRGMVSAQKAAPAFSYPMGLPGRPLGDGMFVRIAYAAENARYYPGWWHTGENWHALDGDTAGMGVHAAADGEVVFAGAEYPGLVVIIRHAGGLYSGYGHLDYVLAIEAGQRVARGDLLGTVLARADDYARSHLHFEVRTFFTKAEINGAAPQYGVSCGYECPPGPGYWPMTAPEHPSDLGWLDPTHVINRRAWADGVPRGTDVIAAEEAPPSIPLWTLPSDTPGAERIGDLALRPGNRVSLLAVATGEEGSTGTSAEASRLWYQIALPDGAAGWARAAVPSDWDTGSDGRPSSVRFHFLPAVVSD